MKAATIYSYHVHTKGCKILLNLNTKMFTKKFSSVLEVLLLHQCLLLLSYFLGWIQRDPDRVNRAWCKACHSSLAPKKSGLINHIVSVRHLEAVRNVGNGVS